MRKYGNNEYFTLFYHVLKLLLLEKVMLYVYDTGTIVTLVL